MCNNNCCMCCNCNTNTNNEETTQEVVYTSVCNSDTCQQLANQCQCCNCCNCEKYKGLCEDDPENMVLALQEHMEECCQTVGERLDAVECELDREIYTFKAKDEEHDDKIQDLYDKESLDYNNVNYTLDNHNLVINFYHDDIFQDKITIPVESFIKDWFVDDVDLIDSHILKITFNTDPTTETHHEPRIIYIDLNDFLNPSSYYTKTEVSNTYETKVAAGNHITNVDYDQNDHHTLIFTKENGNTIAKTIPDSDQYIQSGQYTGGNLVLTKNNGDTVTIPVPSTNHVVGGSISGRTITLTRENSGTPITIELPSDANTYPVSGSVNGNTLTITNSDGSTVPITLPSYSTTDNDHYPTQASLSGNTLTISGNSGFSPFSIDLSGISGTTNVTYGGNAVTIQQAITAIENRLNALEGLWKKTANNDGLEPVTATHKVYGYGFYDTSVSQPAF